MTIHRVTITYIGYRVNVKEHNHYKIYADQELA